MHSINPLFSFPLDLFRTPFIHLCAQCAGLFPTDDNNLHTRPMDGDLGLHKIAITIASRHVGTFLANYISSPINISATDNTSNVPTRKISCV